jgi:hypothetical protein
MCFVYGGFVTVLALLAVTWTGRAGLGFCGAFMIAVGALIRRSIVRRDRASVMRATPDLALPRTKL